ncbi:MAG: protease modulator HflC [Alphaproteobacteria bacterium]
MIRRFSQSQLIIIAIIAVGAVIALSQTLYEVDQTQQAVVLQIGRPVRVVNASGAHPGLKAKIPFLENVIKFDRRSIALEPEAAEITASNQEKLMVDAFLRYRIKDPLLYYRAFQTDRNAEDRLDRLVASSLRQALGAATTDEIISSNRAEIMRRVRDDVDRRAKVSRYGVEIVDLRIKRADLPQANEEKVFNRMNTQRQQEAQQYRAMGDQEAQTILAEANKQASTTRGQGDAERARIMAQSFGQDPGFAAFYRSLRAYENSLANPESVLVLSPDSDFFRYFEQGPGR